MAGAPEKFTKEQMIAMARECKGMAYVMARRLGCAVKTVYNYRDRYDEVREAMEHEDGMVDDIAELKLFEAIKDGQAWAIRFRLKHKGKGRGYSEKREIDVTSNGEGIERTVLILPDNGRGPDDDG